MFVTAFYSFRMYFLVFHGDERYDQNPEAHHAHDHDHGHGDSEHGDDHDKPHESPWVVTLPLVLLAIPSLGLGFFTITPLLFGDFFKDSIVINEMLHPSMKELSEAFEGPIEMALHSVTSAPFLLALLGVVLSYYMYMINPALPTAIKRLCSPIYTLLENKYFMDWFNENVLARGTRAIGQGLWTRGDQGVIDGFFVNGAWKLVGRAASVIRKFQSGFLFHYALSMIFGLFLLMSWFLWLNV